MIQIHTIGRVGTDVTLTDSVQSVSKTHAELTLSTDRRNFYLVDCGSSNGTFIHRQGIWDRIKQDVVRPGDLLRFGAVQISMDDLLTRLPQRPAAVR